MVILLITAIITITVGVFMLIRSDYLMRVPLKNCNSNKAGRRIKQTVQGNTEYMGYDEEFCNDPNIYVLSKRGIVLCVLGILSMAIYFVISFLDK